MEPEVGPDVGLGAGRDASRGQGPGWRLRVVEGAGLVAVVWGLGAGPWWLIAVGAALIFGSYAAYRRRHVAVGGGGDPGLGDSDGGDD